MVVAVTVERCEWMALKMGASIVEINTHTKDNNINYVDIHTS
jgi:hypothetical protein